ncbi:MAG: efflux RND transporter periplasmic adaptor subunit [Chitinophagaceae bacterium]|nr:MAG: efflux RND transporter periplasmic adaptor subunit [Chitinophagaceae bacterium]
MEQATKKKSVFRRIILPIIIIAALLFGIGNVLTKNKAKNKAATDEVSKKNEFVTVRVDTVRMQNMDASYLANGTFIPKQEVIVGAEVAGRVVRVLAKEGDYVRAGQVLAIVEGEKLDVNVANAQAAYNTAKINLERFESALKTGGVTSQQVDQMRLQFENAKNQLKASQITASDVTIKTSVAGIVNARKIEPGSYVNTGNAAFDIVNISSLKLRVNVDEKNVAALKVGQNVKINVSVFPENNYTGKIVFIAPKSDGSLNFPVEIEIVNTGNQLKAGMYGTATFGYGQSANAMVVPRTAFVGSVSDNLIFVAKGGKAVQTKVQSGRNFGDFVEVLSGLTTGDQVITSGQVNIINGTAVQIIK